MKRHNYIIILFLVLTLFSCDGNREQRGIVTEYVGKQINIPEGLTYQIIESQFDYDFNEHKQ